MAEVGTGEESIDNWIERSGVEAVDDEFDEGWIAKGGDLSPELLIDAYKCGVFPWDVNPEIEWYAPRKRMVLLTSELHVGATMRRVLSRSSLEITLDRAFNSVVRNCAVTDINDSRSGGLGLMIQSSRHTPNCTNRGSPTVAKLGGRGNLLEGFTAYP